MLVLIEEQIRPLLRWDDLIPTMESALAAFSEGRVIQPVRNMITIEEGRRYLGVMPAVAEAAMGLKLVSFYPGNAPSLSPSRNASYQAFSPELSRYAMRGVVARWARVATGHTAVVETKPARKSRRLIR